MEPTNELSQGIKMSDIRRAMPFAGVVLILFGLVRRSPMSVLLAAIGGGMVYDGLKHGMFETPISHEKGMPTQQTLAQDEGVRVEQEVTVNRSPQEVYRYWRNLENLPRVMSYLESVKVISPMRSHWVAKAPAGIHVAWDAEMINDEENARIGWRSMPGSDVPNAGSVVFEPAPGGHGTVVHVNLKYDLPMGPVGTAMAKLFGSDPSQMLAQDLHQFKVSMENGHTSA